jgi:hypothetical protein
LWRNSPAIDQCGIFAQDNPDIWHQKNPSIRYDPNSIRDFGRKTGVGQGQRVGINHWCGLPLVFLGARYRGLQKRIGTE